MDVLKTMTYHTTGRIARITLNRPARGNAITFDTPTELTACIERASLDPTIHVIAMSGSGAGFCSGYDLITTAEQQLSNEDEADIGVKGSPLDLAMQMANHDPNSIWDPMIDYAMMRRFVQAYMSLFHSDKPVVCKVHGFCVGGGTDIALCSDLLVIEKTAKIGYPPARVWGSPTTAIWAFRIGIEKSKRLLFTGDSLSGTQAVEWGLATEAHSTEMLDEQFERLLERIAQMPINQLMMMKLLVNQTIMAQGLHSTQILGTLFDGIARHTREGYAFQQRAAEVGFKQAVRERDEPFGDLGRSTFKG